MTVSAAAKRSEEAKAAEDGGPGKGGTPPPPSSFRAVALVGAPRCVSAATIVAALDVVLIAVFSGAAQKCALSRGTGRGCN